MQACRWCSPARSRPRTGTRRRALRFVLEGDGAHTVVNGERTTMHDGDFIITPPMAWHDHGNESEAADVSGSTGSTSRSSSSWTRRSPSTWARTSSRSPASRTTAQPATAPTCCRSIMRARRRLLADLQLSIRAHARGARADEAAGRVGSLPRAEDALHQPRDGRPRDGDDGRRSCSCCRPGSGPRRTARPTRPCSSPIEGGDARISARISRSSGGRRTCSSCRAGSRVRHEAAEESVLFSFSDRPIQEALGLFREDRGNA